MPDVAAHGPTLPEPSTIRSDRPPGPGNTGAAVLMPEAESDPAGDARHQSSDPDPLPALIGQLVTLHVRIGNMVPSESGDVFDHLLEQSNALDRAIINTRARSIDALVWKLRELVDCLEAEEGIGPWQLAMAKSCLDDAVFLASHLRTRQ